MSADLNKIRRILNPTDFSAGSVGSFAHALRIAIANKSVLHLLHVEAPHEHPRDTHFPRAHELAARWNMIPAGANQSGIKEITGVEIKKTVLIASTAADGIADYAKQHACDLLVMTTRDRSGLRRWIGGSVSGAAAQASRAPALFLRESHKGFVNSSTGETTLTRILAPIDGNIPAKVALELATDLARSLGSEPHVTALHIGQKPPAQDSDLPNLELRNGPVIETVVSFAGEIKADLIVMPTEGRDSPLEALFGSTTERVIHEAPCPVLAVPRNDRQ